MLLFPVVNLVVNQVFFVLFVVLNSVFTTETQRPRRSTRRPGRFATNFTDRTNTYHLYMNSSDGFVLVPLIGSARAVPCTPGRRLPNTSRRATADETTWPITSCAVA
jgi:hypothetical protein